MCVTLAHQALAHDWCNFSLVTIPGPEGLVCSAMCVCDWLLPAAKPNRLVCDVCKRKFSLDFINTTCLLIFSPLATKSSVSCTNLSDSASNALVASSKIRMDGFLIKARAMAILKKVNNERIVFSKITKQVVFNKVLYYKNQKPYWYKNVLFALLKKSSFVSC